jgi:hypothetical protein
MKNLLSPLGYSLTPLRKADAGICSIGNGFQTTDKKLKKD